MANKDLYSAVRLITSGALQCWRGSWLAHTNDINCLH